MRLSVRQLCDVRLPLNRHDKRKMSQLITYLHGSWMPEAYQVLFMSFTYINKQDLERQHSMIHVCLTQLSGVYNLMQQLQLFIYRYPGYLRTS